MRSRRNEKALVSAALLGLGVAAVAAAAGCQSRATVDMGALANGPNEAAPIQNSDEAQVIAYRPVELLAHAPPDSRFTELGPVIVFIERPIPGVTARLSVPWRYASLPTREDGLREDGRHRTTRVDDSPVAALDSELQRALQSRAAEMGAAAVILRNAGIDQRGRLWASGTAIRRN